MGGAGYIFTGEHDAEVMSDNVQININVLNACVNHNFKGRIFYASSACVYKEGPCQEEEAYPANPDSEYGWEKLFSERLYQSYRRNFGINCCIGRFHNIYGPYGTYSGGREKAPAALSRKTCEADKEIEIWGDGEQARSFLFIEEAIRATRLLMESDFEGPVNIGSEEQVSINQLAEIIIKISGKDLTINHVPGPQGVRGRNSDNTLIQEKLDWKPSMKLEDGLKITYDWIKEEVNK
jgi:nucleoside-diphosphate-sugar epimerase